MKILQDSRDEDEELAESILAKIRQHMRNKKNPLKQIIDGFGKAFESSYNEYVNTSSESNRNLMSRI